MTDRIFTPEEEAEIDTQARLRGFTGAREYLRMLIQHDVQASVDAQERRPTLEELMAMPPEARDYWLEKAAALAEPFYLNDPELTITADTVDLYEYPATE